MLGMGENCRGLAQPRETQGWGYRHQLTGSPSSTPSSSAGSPCSNTGSGTDLCRLWGGSPSHAHPIPYLLALGTRRASNALGQREERQQSAGLWSSASPGEQGKLQGSTHLPWRSRIPWLPFGASRA